jgi:hypothetical protein
MRHIGVLVVLVPILFWITTFAAENLGGEVAVLYTSDGTRTFQSNVWLVEDGTDIWLRANQPTRAWLDRVINQPNVKLRRGEIMRDYTATPLSHRRSEINSHMVVNYGWAEWLLAFVEDRDQSVPVYLDPFG